ncbi:MAG: phosphoribosylglycinamide formyltransferase [Candidatus Nitrosocosmicus sp.]
MVNLAILISGRGSNMIAILDAIENKYILNVNKVLVISNKRESIGLHLAKDRYGIETELIINDNLSKNEFDEKIDHVLKSYDIQPSNGLVCLAGFMKILSPYIVNMYKHRIINIHPSLLPSFKGLHAQRQALDAGVKISGCTVHFVDNVVDTGPIILQECVPVFDNDTELVLSERILFEEHKIYKKAINLFTNDMLKIENNKVSLK